MVSLCSHPGFWPSDFGQKTATDLGRGSISQISNDYGPQDTADSDGMDMDVAVGRGLRRLGSRRLGPLYCVFGRTVLIFVYRMVFRGC